MPELRTTLIPKKPASETTRIDPTPKMVSIMILIAAIIFVVSLAAAGGLYFYRALILKNIDELSQSITRAEEIISPALVARLNEYDRRSTIVKTLLDSHVVLSPIFDLLGDLAISSVRFSQFDYDVGRDGDAKMTLAGEARSYASLAAQSDLLGKNEHINDPIFSNFELNPLGNVTFNFSAGISKSLQLYRNTLSESPTPKAPESQVSPTNENGGGGGATTTNQNSS